VAQKLLSQAGKEELALALLLLKDFKCGEKFDVDVTRSILELAQELGVLKEFSALLSKLPPMKVIPRYE
jgi:hypothetical protein